MNQARAAREEESEHGEKEWSVVNPKLFLEDRELLLRIVDFFELFL